VAFPVLPGSDAERHIVSTAGLPQKGVLGLARVQIVECGEFDCPYCARARKTIDDVLAAYPTQVAVYWAHNPLAFHPGAEPAARAAVAADAQGKFWEMHDLLFENRSARSATDFRAWAEKLELDVVRFEADLASEATGTIIEAQQKACTDNEASGTPSFFVNGRLVTGAQPLEVFKAMIDEELAAGI
jgi:protein-disulfide isomerase